MKQHDMASEDTAGTADDAPLIDLNEASIKKLIAKAKRKGYITVDELNAALPQDELNSEQIEDVMSAISEIADITSSICSLDIWSCGRASLSSSTVM